MREGRRLAGLRACQSFFLRHQANAILNGGLSPWSRATMPRSNEAPQKVPQLRFAFSLRGLSLGGPLVQHQRFRRKSLLPSVFCNHGATVRDGPAWEFIATSRLYLKPAHHWLTIALLDSLNKWLNFSGSVRSVTHFG